MESLSSVLEAKRHTEEFEKPKRGNDRRLGDVLGVNRYLVVPPDQVDFAKDSFAGEVGREVVDPWYRVLVVFGNAIELPEVPVGPVAPTPRA